MGEIIFSVFIGTCLVAVGLFMNWDLSKECQKQGREKNKSHSE